MNLPLRLTLCVALLSLPLAAVSAQQPAAGAQLTFHYERPGLPVPVYTLTLRADGSGRYQASPAAVPPANRYAVVASAGPLPIDQTLSLEPADVARVFAWVEGAHYFQQGCASKAKGVANMGAKTLNFTSPAATGACTYNFSENKSVVELVDFLQAMAFTLDEAGRLEAEHRFDRLALDPEMTVLFAAVVEGRATGLSNIRPTLTSLADDPQVLERVRAKARKLLEQSLPAR